MRPREWGLNSHILYLSGHNDTHAVFIPVTDLMACYSNWVVSTIVTHSTGDCTNMFRMKLVCVALTIKQKIKVKNKYDQVIETRLGKRATGAVVRLWVSSGYGVIPVRHTVPYLLKALVRRSGRVWICGAALRSARGNEEGSMNTTLTMGVGVLTN